MDLTMFLSLIIPTRNRANYLVGALESISRQSYPQDLFEIVIVDNGSTDNTKAVCDACLIKLPNLRYYYDTTPGLHIGRHFGMRHARSDILVYADDDIAAFPPWLEAIAESFEDTETVLVGGKTLPKFESEPPDWLLYMWRTNGNGSKILGYLSLLDLGEKQKEISPQYVFGCNFSIRKSVLLESGGFHPDAFPQNLIHFRGDGESYVSNYIQSKKLTTIYNPKASVYHWVPKTRMTVEYFCRRAYNQGISDSYTAFRKNHETSSILSKNVIALKVRCAMNSILDRVKEESVAEISSMIWKKVKANDRSEDPHLYRIRRKIDLAYKAGFAFHQKMVKEDAKVREWVLRENYFGTNGNLPE